MTLGLYAAALFLFVAGVWLLREHISLRIERRVHQAVAAQPRAQGGPVDGAARGLTLAQQAEVQRLVQQMVRQELQRCEERLGEQITGDVWRRISPCLRRDADGNRPRQGEGLDPVSLGRLIRTKVEEEVERRLATGRSAGAPPPAQDPWRQAQVPITEQDLMAWWNAGGGSAIQEEIADKARHHGCEAFAYVNEPELIIWYRGGHGERVDGLLLVRPGAAIFGLSHYKTEPPQDRPQGVVASVVRPARLRLPAGLMPSLRQGSGPFGEVGGLGANYVEPGIVSVREA